MEYTAFATCQRCGQMKVQIEGGEAQCLLCGSGNVDNPALVVDIEDPGEEAMNAVLAKTGVKLMPGTKPVAPEKPIIEANRVINAPKREAKVVVQQTIGTTVEDALTILRSLPMPKDLKQFKQINKAIKILETLGE